MKVIAIVQARMGSTRLPGKVLLPLGGKPVLQWVVERTRAAIPDVVIATTEEEADNPIAYLGWELETPVVRYGTGKATNDVFTRFRRVLEQFQCDAFVRVTADCPLVEPYSIKSLLWQMTQTRYSDMDGASYLCDYIDGSVGAGHVDGLDCEGVRTEAFLRCLAADLSAHDREHVTTILRQLPIPKDRLHYLLTEGYDPCLCRLTLDTQRDYERLQRIWAEVPHGPYGPNTLKALTWLERHPEWWGDAT